MNEQIFFKLYSLSHQNYFLDKIIIFCAEYLPYIVILGVFIYVFRADFGNFDYRKPFEIIKKRFRSLFNIFIPGVLGWVTVDIIKGVVKSPRPFLEFKETVEPLFVHGGLDSFPSGHATFFVSLAVSSFFVNKKLGYALFFCAILISLSRVISGIHFPIDILFGFIFGLIISLIYNLISKKSLKNKI